MDEIESLPDLTRTLRTRVPLRGLRLQDLDLTGHEERAARPHRRRGHGRARRAGDRRARRPPALARRARLPDRPARAGQPVPLVASTSRTSCTTGLHEHGYEATPDARAYHWSRDGSLRARRLRHPAAGHPRRLDHRRARRVPRGGVRRRASWAATPSRARHRAVRRGCPARPPARSGRARRRHRWRAGGDGGRQPRRPGARRHGPRRRAGPARRRPVVRPRHRTVGRGGARRARRPAADPGGRPAGAQHRHPHVVLRPRAAQRVLQRHRQVLLERAARGRPARALHLRARRPRGCGGHGAGDLPGRHPALLRRPGVGAAGRRARRRAPLDPASCRCGRRCARWPAAGAMAERLHLVATVDDAAELVTSSR